MSDKKLTALFIFSCLFSVFFSLPVFVTVDDFGIMLDLLAGFEAPFIHTGLSLFFAEIYKLNDSIPWYGVILFSLQLFVCSLLFKGLLKVSGSKSYFFKFFLFVTCFLMCIQLSYNNLATYCALASFTHFYNSNFKITFLNVFFIAIGVLFRVELFVLSYILLAGIGVLIVPKLKLLAKWVVSGAVITVLLMLISILLFKTVSSEEFKKFQSFNLTRGFFHDFPIMDEVVKKKEYEHIGWDENDVYFFTHWYFLDEEKFNTANLKKLRDYHNLNSQETSLLSDFSLKRFIYNNWMFNTFLVILLFGLFSYKRGRSEFFIIFSILFLVWITCYLRTPSRMTVPFATSVLILASLGQLFTKKWQRFFLPFIFLVLIFSRTAKYYFEGWHKAKQQDEIHQSFLEGEELNFENTQMSFYLLNGAYSFPFKDYRKFSHLTYFNWSFFSSRYYRDLKFNSLKDLKNAMTFSCQVVVFYLPREGIEIFQVMVKHFFGNDFNIVFAAKENYLTAKVSYRHCE